MRKFVTQTARKNAIFLLTAAWLFTLAFIVDNYWYASSSVRYLHKNIQEDIQEQERDFEKLVGDTILLKKLVNESYNEKDLETFLEKSYCFSIYSTNGAGVYEHRFWNNQLVTPDNYFLNKTETSVLDTLENGQYVFKRKIVTLFSDRQVLAIAFIPVRRQYFIQVEDNLRQEFVNYDQAEKNILITTDSTDYGVKSIDGNTLFYLQKKFIAPGDNSNNFSLTLNILGFLLLLMALHNISHAISEEYGYLKGVLFLTGWVILIRSITYYYPRIISVKDYGLFDPLIYSSSRVLNSLGDLMINAFLFCWIVLFIRREVGNRRFRLTENSAGKWPALFIPLFLLVSITFILASIIKSLIADAKISFNVTNFFGLNEYSYIGFIVMGTLTLSFFYFSQVVMQLISPLLKGSTKNMLFVWVAIIGLILLTIIRNTSYIEMNIYVLIWLLAYLWFMQQQTVSAAGFKMAVSEVLVWLFIFSASISTVIIAENKTIELEQRKSTAEK